MGRRALCVGIGLLAIATKAQGQSVDVAHPVEISSWARHLFDVSQPLHNDLADEDFGQEATVASPEAPLLLMALPPSPPSPYAPPEPEKQEDLLNQGGVNIDLNFHYLTDEVYRGISHNRAVFNSQPGGKLHSANFQIDTKLSFNFGSALPHPFIGVFGNVNDSDPLSRFQEIRPFFGFDFTFRPLTMTVGDNTYIYPERERFNPNPNTAEAYIRLTLDDSFFFRTPHPIFSPYVYGAYDYNRNQGWYLEAGVKHDFEFPDFGFTFSPYADVAYVSHFRQQFLVVAPHSSGFQHYDVGIVGSLSLNHLLRVKPHYGTFSLEGYLTYTGHFDNQTTGDSELWGGVGLAFKY